MSQLSGPETARAPSRSSWLLPVLLLVPALIALGAVIATVISSLSAPEPVSIRGVRLGMTADQIRERFDRGTEASWRTEVAGTDLTLIRGPAGDLDRETRFEIHDGMLVAIRLDVRDDLPEADGDRIVTTPASVLVRSPEEPGRTRISLLARDCPTHADEVSSILSDAP